MRMLAGAVLGLLFAQVCCVQGADVEQSPPALSLQEGASYTLWCNFSTSSQSVNWYLQNPGGRIIHLFSVPSGTKQEGRLKATTVPAERRSSLHISSARTTDSGTYFCAAQHGALQATAASTRTLPGRSPSSSLSHTVRPHRVFAVLHVTHLHQDSFNHRYFLALQITDFGLYLSFSTCISFRTRNF
ncbi:hypothetical protein FD754_024150 [Muntiacus muntjak]|uniref:Ig-like domain-containing protein n=1 Tax=Muntiacus muntjak TaxID=9888 RepID=A0A5N3UQS0_MUNMU|nr:hypothetical protein FD754_024150 [Muntiacus muntjak]